MAKSRSPQIHQWVLGAVKDAGAWGNVHVQFGTGNFQEHEVQKKHEEACVMWRHRTVGLLLIPECFLSAKWVICWYCIVIHEIAHAMCPVSPDDISIEEEVFLLLATEEWIHRKMGTLAWWRNSMWQNWRFEREGKECSFAQLHVDERSIILKTSREVAQQYLLIPAADSKRKHTPVIWPDQDKARLSAQKVPGKARGSSATL